MIQNLEQKRNIDQDQRGNPIMTVKTIKYYCSKDSLFETPELNQKLYLHYKGFKKIEALEHYPNLVTIWLNNNCISGISGLDSLKNLICLYLNNNVITKIMNLDELTNLSILNLAHNKIQKIENLSKLKNLNTLNISQNFLTNKQSIEGLLECPSITSLNLSKNQISNSDQIITVLKGLQSLTCVYLKATPLSRGYKFYRKTLTYTLKKLKFLDDRPIKQIDHRLCEAWMKGGVELENQEKAKIIQQRQQHEINDKEKLKMKLVYEKAKQQQKIKIKQIEQQISKDPIREFEEPVIEPEQENDEQRRIREEYEKEERKEIEGKVRGMLNLEGEVGRISSVEDLNIINEEIQEDNSHLYFKYWNQKYEPLLQALIEKYKFDFTEVQPSFNMILANINKKMVRPHRRFEIKQLQKIWTAIEIKKRKASKPV